MALDSSTKDNAKAEYIPAIFTSERVFLRCFFRLSLLFAPELSTNSRQLSLSFCQLASITFIDSYELSRVSALINSRSGLGRSLGGVLVAVFLVLAQSPYYVVTK